jgi:protease-4
MQKSLNEIYEQFTKKAAQGRKMPYDQLEKLARGRVYTGAMALKIGLVDELGSLQDAIAYAEKQAGFKAGEKVERMELPKARNPLESLFGPIDSEAELQVGLTNDLVQALSKFAPEVVEHLRSAQLVNVLAREGRLTLMPFRIKVR